MLYCIIKMNKINKRILPLLAIVCRFGLSISSLRYVNAVDSAILPANTDISDLLNIVLVILTTGVGIAATVAFVVAGVLYMSAAGSAEQVKKAKNMIFNTVIGLLAYLLMWAFLSWLIPGGVL